MAIGEGSGRISNGSSMSREIVVTVKRDLS